MHGLFNRVSSRLSITISYDFINNRQTTHESKTCHTKKQLSDFFCLLERDVLLLSHRPNGGVYSHFHVFGKINGEDHNFSTTQFSVLRDYLGRNNLIPWSSATVILEAPRPL